MIKWNNCNFSYGEKKVIEDFSLETEETGTTVFLGPSGCGKSTLLHLTANLLAPDSGQISSGTKNISYLFQKPRLLPWKTVRENISFALPDKMNEVEKQERCDELMEIVGLKGFEEYHPSQLSGGMEQRCAIARAFVTSSPLILMDEPFKSLDLKLKMPLLALLAILLKSNGTSALLVTHDVKEAILMGDRILLLDGPPLKLIKDLKGLETREERKTSSPAFYELERTLCHLILKD